MYCWFNLQEGVTTIGTDDGDDDDKQDIVLRGNGMEPKHCTITFVNGVAILEPKRGAQVWLNNALIESPARLSQGCIIFLGRAHVFRFNDPAEAAELRKGENKSLNLSRLSLLSWSTPDLVTTSMDNLQQTYVIKAYDHIERQKFTGDLNSSHFFFFGFLVVSRMTNRRIQLLMIAPKLPINDCPSSRRRKTWRKNRKSSRNVGSH